MFIHGVFQEEYIPVKYEQIISKATIRTMHGLLSTPAEVELETMTSNTQ